MDTTIRTDNAASPAGPRFVHLKVHSAYSLLEGALQIATLAKLATAQRMPAIALTDSNNMFGVLEFSDKVAAAGIQPIAGCALQTDFGKFREDFELIGTHLGRASTKYGDAEKRLGRFEGKLERAAELQPDTGGAEPPALPLARDAA